ncbi:MAG: hypothetical protein WAK17_19860 [Candidatus Nitrosopolaris sp.]|jgi:hypothetical protein
MIIPILIMDHVPTFDEIRNGGFALAVKLSIEKKYDEAKEVLTEVLKEEGLPKILKLWP